MNWMVVWLFAGMGYVAFVEILLGSIFCFISDGRFLTPVWRIRNDYVKLGTMVAICLAPLALTLLGLAGIFLWENIKVSSIVIGSVIASVVIILGARYVVRRLFP